MDYEKKYKEALKRAKDVHTYYCDDRVQLRKIESIFPELRESEDERIRKEIKVILVNTDFSQFALDYTYTDMVTWLEKQGKHKDYYTKQELIDMGFSFTLNGDIVTPDKMMENMKKYLAQNEKQGNTNETTNTDELAQCVLRGAAINLITWIDYNAAEGNTCLSNTECKDITDALVGGDLEKQGEKPQGKTAFEAIKDEQKPINKVEPKFKVGDWVVTSYGKVNQVVTVDEDGDGFTLDDDTYFSGSWKDGYHPWTIADAKDGDILTSSYGQPFIYNGYYDSYSVGAYGGLDCVSDDFTRSTTGKYWTSNIGIHPATKEQRDALFEKMKEAHYEWDNDKKELRKIVVPIFNIGDTIIKKHNSYINKFGPFTITDISGGKYWYDESIICNIQEQDDWEVVK